MPWYNSGMDIKIYKQGRLTFILTDTQTLIQTTLPQTFYLEPKAYCWKKRLKLIRTMIELGEVRDLNELSGWCGNGIEWVTTSKNYAGNSRLSNVL